jgi:hypothetical protein
MKWIGFFIFGLVGSVLAAEEEKSDWSVRSYSFPKDFFQGPSYYTQTDLLSELAVDLKLQEGDVAVPRELSKEPGEVEEKYDEEKIKASIKKTSKRWREVLKELPEGTLVALDVPRATFAARTTEAGHDIFWSMFNDHIMLNLPKMVAVQVSLFEVPTTEAEALQEETGGKADHTGALERLEKAGVRVVASGSLETKSGQRAATKMMTDVSHVTEFAARADGSTEGTGREVEPVGLTVEFDPVLGVDQHTLDLNIAIRHTTQAGAPRAVPLGTVGGKRVEGGVQDFVTENWTTATTMTAGQSRLLGVAPAEETGKSRLCFVTAASPRVHLAVASDGRAAGWLTKYGDSIEPVPSGAARSNRKVPEAMVKKSFRVPPDFLSSGSSLDGDTSSLPADPFADPTATSRVDPLTHKKTAKEILTEQGIIFPEGSSATYLKQSSTLTVVNTPTMMELVETFVGSCDFQPAILQFRLHVVEAGSAVVRKLARESLTVTDHRAAWEALQAEITAERGRVVGAAAIETKSGQRCTVESGRWYAWANATLKAQVPEAKGDNGSVVVTGMPVAELEATVEREPLGLHWEIDPVLGADGFTIDVNTSVRRHSLEPTERFAAPVAQEGVMTVDAPAVDFHPLELLTAFTTQDGMWRMIGTWQPMGADGELDPAVMQAVFVRASVVRVGQ